MRLFRRTLLCLVVGVTAFGAAGWGFRPKPTATEVVASDTLTRPIQALVRDEDTRPVPPQPLAIDPALASPSQSCLKRLPDWTEKTVEHLVEQRGGLRLWLAHPPLSTSLWIGVDDGRRPILGWTPYPVAVALRPFLFPCVADPTYLPRMIPGQPAASFAPNGHGIVEVATELPPSSALPDGVIAMLPDDSDLFRSHVAARWFDLQINRWFDAGARDFSDFDIVEANLVTLSITSERRLKQSWPLPPRDPKWPALGIGIACAAGTWWFFARRAARKSIA
jgi:hypothetical protein